MSPLKRRVAAALVVNTGRYVEPHCDTLYDAYQPPVDIATQAVTMSRHAVLLLLRRCTPSASSESANVLETTAVRLPSEIHAICRALQWRGSGGMHSAVSTTAVARKRRPRSTCRVTHAVQRVMKLRWQKYCRNCQARVRESGALNSTCTSKVCPEI